ncbi:MAG TPA: hypothetical protein VNA25_12755 [Phycisphaerae bacterium]|nr:hypothetical protein [Phycisphaerae bacterium]
MRIPKKITVAFLRKLGACQSSVELFAKVFPNGATITQGNIKKAWAADLSIMWLAKRILSAAERAKFDKDIDPAWAEYEKDYAAINAKYREAIAPVLVRIIKAAQKGQ